MLCAKIKSSQVIKSNSFHYLSQPPTDFTITHQFYIENIYNAIVSSLADLLALLFAREEMMDVFCALCQNKIKSSDKVQFISLSIQPPTDFTITHQFFIENIYNAIVSSLADLLALLFAREEISSTCAFGSKFKSQLILLFSLFLLLFMGLIALFGTIYGPTILFQLTFPFIYSIFNKKFSVLAK